jgi:hypothetical protein
MVTLASNIMRREDSVKTIENLKILSEIWEKSLVEIGYKERNDLK